MIGSSVRTTGTNHWPQVAVSLKFKLGWTPGVTSPERAASDRGKRSRDQKYLAWLSSVGGDFGTTRYNRLWHPSVLGAVPGFTVFGGGSACVRLEQLALLAALMSSDQEVPHGALLLAEYDVLMFWHRRTYYVNGQLHLKCTYNKWWRHQWCLHHFVYAGQCIHFECALRVGAPECGAAPALSQSK